jgi:hypothetical protein
VSSFAQTQARIRSAVQECMREAARIASDLVVSLHSYSGLQNQQNCQGQLSRLWNNTFVSSDNPNIRVSVDTRFKYIWSVPFAIEKVARGNRYQALTEPVTVQKRLVGSYSGKLPILRANAR